MMKYFRKTIAWRGPCYLWSSYTAVREKTNKQNKKQKTKNKTTNKQTNMNYPSSSEVGVVATPKIFLKQLFGANNLHQTFQGNHFYILFASCNAYEVKLAGVVWVWGSLKRMEGGSGEIP